MQFTLHFRHDIMSMLKAVPNPRKTAMAGKTPVHSGVIFYPKDRIAVHAAVRSFSFHHKEVIHEERKKDKFPHCRYHTCRFRLPKEETSFRPVSYTHLTLPTILRV